MLYLILKIELQQLLALLLILICSVTSKQSTPVPTNSKLVLPIQAPVETPIPGAEQRAILRQLVTSSNNPKPEFILTQTGNGTGSKIEQSEKLTSGGISGGQKQIKEQTSSYKLPSYFNYDLYRRFFGKPALSPVELEFRRRLYLRTALKVFEQRALFRTQRLDSVPSVNELSDMSIDELEAFHRQQTMKRPIAVASSSLNQLERESLICCNHDQVYKRIIDLLNSTTSNEDLKLSRALVDELEQKPLLKVSSMISSEGNVDLHSKHAEIERVGLLSRRLVEDKHESSKILEEDKEKGNDKEGTLFRQAIQADIERQVAEQLASAGGQEWKRQLSAYFGEPVELQVRPTFSSKVGDTKKSSFIR